MIKLDRRSFVLAVAMGTLAWTVPAWGQDVNVDELLRPGQLGERSLGPTDAKVTVVEYASLSCPHCAHFDTSTFDQFKLKYIDSGKVRYIFREFPLNAPAYAAASVARCAPADKFFDVVHAYFRQQTVWLSSSNLKASTLDIAKEFGFTQQSFEACLTNQALFKAIDEVKSRGASLGVSATPTFFINGKKYQGALTIEDLDKAIEPLL
jgi:protein-disulfide isomerase